MDNSWGYKPLVEVVEILDSKRKPINSKQRAARVQGKNITDLYPYYGATGQVGYIDDYLLEGEYVLLGEDGAPFLDAYANKAYMITGKSWVNNHAHILRSKYNNSFLCYYLNSFNYKGYVSGTTRLKLTQSDMKRIPIPVPPIAEQERIVSQIEETLSQLDSAVETLKKTKQQLEVYRQSVLMEAFNDIKTSVTLDQLANMIDPQPSHRTPPEHKKGVPYIGIGDIDYIKNTIDFARARKVAPELLKEHLERYTIHQGDFVMGKIGTIGKPFRLPLPQNYLLSANVILIQPVSEMILPEFLFWQFSSHYVTKQLISGANATSQPAFGIKKARLLNIKICPLDKQKQIFEIINNKLSICDNIEKTVEQLLKQAEALRQSILKQAFGGKIDK